MWFDFRWISWNLAKIAKHGVEPDDCEWVVRRSRPRRSGRDKFIVRGRTRQGRLLQVVYLMDDQITVFVIHAMYI